MHTACLPSIVPSPADLKLELLEVSVAVMVRFVVQSERHEPNLP